MTRAVALLILSFCFSLPALGDKRVALVVGNSEYTIGPLRNPKNDADDLSAALKRLHFDVSEYKDLNIRGFDDALDGFVEKAKDADIAMFFFSGHGVQIDKRGYLAPVDIKVESESSALRELVAIQEIVSRIEHAAKVSVIMLDACRDSPLQERLRRIAVTKNKALEPPKGLPPVSVVGSDTLIVYATVPGETASDGSGRNSPFTTALLKHIEEPNLDMELMFKRVTGEVLAATDGKQQPERLSRLQSELILMLDTAEQQLWDSVKDSTDPEVIATYTARYPKGTFAPLVPGLLKQIEQQRLLDQAVKEEEKRRAEASRKEAEVQQIEKDLKARETALADEMKRIEEAKARQQEEQSREAGKAGAAPKPDEAKLLEETRRTEELKYGEELRKAKEEARIANEAAQAAEKRRQATEKAAAAARLKEKSAALEPGSPKASRPANLSGYSHKYWPKNSLTRGQTVTADTPFGKLTCTSMGRETPRDCSLH